MYDMILVVAWFLSTCFVGSGEETSFKLCQRKPDNSMGKVSPLSLKITSNNPSCESCDELKTCTTFDGSIQILVLSRSANASVLRQLHFPFLTEITGHLLISRVHSKTSLKDIFPKLAVIRGRLSSLFLDYALIIYMNDGLRYINLPSLTTIHSGGVRIEKNINLCYVKTIRWKSIVKASSDDDSIVIGSNNNDCYGGCYGKGACSPPAGHGDGGNAYCWSEGNSVDSSCQKFCEGHCGERGCVDGSKDICCHKECLGGCSKKNSARHCHACLKLRLSDGTCVSKCPSEMYEVDKFQCVDKCPSSYYKLEAKGMCVKECPAGYREIDLPSFVKPIKDRCEECVDEKCPKVCETSSNPKTEKRPPIDSKATSALYKECTEIKGKLIIKIQGTGGSGIATILEENLGKIEVVSGYILIRASPLLSLNFLKNLKAIKPRRLYNNKYALAILDNPKLKTLWPFYPKLTISNGGIMIHLNPHLCPSKIYPLVTDVLKWNRTNPVRHVDISDSTNGIPALCNVRKINMTAKEDLNPPRRCGQICVLVQWNEVVIEGDYRNVLFYTVSYREAPNRNITEYDNTDVYSANSQYVWTKVDVIVTDTLGVVSQHIGKLKPFMLYAFKVEAVVLKNESAKSDLFFFKTREQAPSQPVGLEVTYLSSESLNVKWKVPLFPNGIITKYVVKYKKSSYSLWMEHKDFNWCSREIFNTKNGGPDTGETTDPSIVEDIGSRTQNICEDKKEEVKPDKEAALFAKKFQDRLFRVIFVKDDDEPDNSTTTTVATPSKNNAVENCSSNAEGCGSSTAAPADGTIPSTMDMTTPTTPGHTTAVPTKNPFKPVEIHVNGSQFSLDIDELEHFSDYIVQVCACTKAGCAKDSSCSTTKGRTDKGARADDLNGPLIVHTDNKFQSYNVSWIAPPSPNAVVLKYEVEITRDTNKPTLRCEKGGITWYHRVGATLGNYSVRVRAITPAGNGSWSEPKTFRLTQDRVPTKGTADGWRITTGGIVVLILGSAAIALLSVFMFLFRRKRRINVSEENALKPLLPLTAYAVSSVNDILNSPYYEEVQNVQYRNLQINGTLNLPLHLQDVFLNFEQLYENLRYKRLQHIAPRRRSFSGAVNERGEPIYDTLSRLVVMATDVDPAAEASQEAKMEDSRKRSHSVDLGHLDHFVKVMQSTGVPNTPQSIVRETRV